MRSMTGFGRGVAEAAGARATVDVRAVNHRFLDLKLRGTPLAPALEEAVGARVRAAVERGALIVSVHVTRPMLATEVRIDQAAAVRAHATLATLATTLGIAPPELALVLAQPGVIVPAAEPGADDPAAPVEPAVLAALDAALVQLGSMRDAEGRALATDLTARFADLTTVRATLAAVAASAPGAIARRLRDRVTRLLEDAGGDAKQTMDPVRLAQEIALLADRTDVTEELVRLASHLDQCRALVAGSTAAGRRLDFLCQELGRELNTIGSKSASADLTAAVVEGKAALEKLREQVQNVE